MASKNDPKSRNNKKQVQTFEKKVRPKKELILVEDTPSVTTLIGDREVIGTKKQFGKKYLIVKNV